MRKSKDDIVRYTEAELRALKDAGKTHSDWNAAGRMPIPDGGDPDDAMEPVAWATVELPAPKRKEHTNLRLDADVLAFFRKQGRGYQTRINAVLRSYVEHASRNSGKASQRKTPAKARTSAEGEVLASLQKK